MKSGFKQSSTDEAAAFLSNAHAVLSNELSKAVKQCPTGSGVPFLSNPFKQRVKQYLKEGLKKAIKILSLYLSHPKKEKPSAKKKTKT
jgi:hypothetical protein